MPPSTDTSSELNDPDGEIERLLQEKRAAVPPPINEYGEINDPGDEIERLKSEKLVPPGTLPVYPEIEPTPWPPPEAESPSVDRRRPLIWIAGAVATLLALLLLILLTLRGGSGLGGTPTAAAPVPTMQPPVATVLVPITSVPLVPTPDSKTSLALSYTDGMQALKDQQWTTAAAKLQDVYNADPNYIDVVQSLSEAYYQIALRDLAEGRAGTALERLNRALAVNPLHPTAKETQGQVLLYLDGYKAHQEQSWDIAIEKLEELRERVPGDQQSRVFSDTAQLLYDSYMGKAGLLEQQKPPQVAAALKLYRSALKLPVDHATADERVSALTPRRFVGTLFDHKHDGAVACGSSFESTVYGRVRDAADNRLAGVTVRVTSSDGHNSYTATTDRRGEFKVPGLGCTTWRTQIVKAPDAPGGVTSSIIPADLNGGRLSAAGVEFRRQ